MQSQGNRPGRDQRASDMNLGVLTWVALPLVSSAAQSNPSNGSWRCSHPSPRVRRLAVSVGQFRLGVAPS